MNMNWQEKRLYRSRKDAWMGGVCGGIAEYFGIDSTLVRLGAVALSFTAGLNFIIYIIAWCVIPEAPKKKNKSAKQRAKDDNYAAYEVDDHHDHHEDNHEESYDERSNGPRY